MGQMLSKSVLLQRQALKVQKVEFEDGDYLFVREMTGKDRDNFELAILKERVDEKGETVGYNQILNNFRAKLAVVTICDEKGDLLLAPGDADKLSECISITRLEAIIKAAQELNKISKEDKAKLLGNSKADQTGNSISN